MNVALEASGNVRALENCIGAIRPEGRIVQVGIAHEQSGRKGIGTDRYLSRDKSNCIGGGNSALRAAARDLQTCTSKPGAGRSSCGKDPDNIVNHCTDRAGGLQLELSKAVRDDIQIDRQFASRLARVIRNAVAAFGFDNRRGR